MFFIFCFVLFKSREQVYAHVEYMKQDGLNTLKYDVTRAETYRTHTHIFVKYTAPSNLAETNKMLLDSVNPQLVVRKTN